jgi:16S rRNA C1402 (ribose-2'-O) methylase RsmI
LPAGWRGSTLPLELSAQHHLAALAVSGILAAVFTCAGFLARHQHQPLLHLVLLLARLM